MRFYNQSEEDLDLRLMFPVGNIPGSLYILDPNFDYYEVLADGERIDKHLRFSYDQDPNSFEQISDLSYLSDAYGENELYDLNRDTKVRLYTFGFELDDDVDAYLELTSKKDLFLSGDLSFFAKEDNKLEFGFTRGLKQGQIAIINDEAIDLTWRFQKGDERCKGVAYIQDVREMSLEEYVLTIRKNTLISDRDWFNIVLACMGNYLDMQERSACFIDLGMLDSLEFFTMCWFEYELEIKGGQTLVNTVEAPLFPSLNLEYEPTLYEFCYLLSPAGIWRDLEELEIRINTDYYLIDDGMGFVKDEKGYSLKLGQLPKGELEFGLAENIELTKIDHGYQRTFWLFLFPIASFVIIAIIIIAILLINKIIRKK